MSISELHDVVSVGIAGSSMSSGSLLSNAHCIRHCVLLTLQIARAGRTQYSRLNGPTEIWRHVRALSASSTADSSAISGNVKQGNDDEFYRHHLSLKPRSEKPTPNKGLVSLSPEACREALPSKYQQDPLSAVDQFSSSVDLVRAALEAHISHTHGGFSPEHKQDIRAAFAEAKAGLRTLRWIVNSGFLDTFDLALSSRLLQDMTHCLVAEQAEQVVWDLVLVRYRPKFADNITDAGRPTNWKGAAVRALLEAQCFWTDKKDTFRDALDSYFFCIKECKNRALPFPLRVPGTWLNKQLVRCSTAAIDDGRYEHFISSLRIWHHDHVELAFMQASLHLAHPTRPSAQGMVIFLEQYAGSQRGSQKGSHFAQDLFESKESSVAYMFFWKIIQTARLLEKEGDKAKARWVLDIGKQRRPDLFSSDWKRHRGALTDGVTLRRRKPTDQEIARGVPLDSEGFVIRSPTSLRIWRVGREAPKYGGGQSKP